MKVEALRRIENALIQFGGTPDQARKVAEAISEAVDDDTVTKDHLDARFKGLEKRLILYIVGTVLLSAVAQITTILLHH